MTGGTVTLPTVNLTGPVNSSAFGLNFFQAGGVGTQSISIQNTLAGAANLAQLAVGNDVGHFTEIEEFSSTFTPSGGSFADGGKLLQTGAGGLTIQTLSGPITFYLGATARGTLFPSGGFAWTAGGGADPGVNNIAVGGAVTALNLVTSGILTASQGTQIGSVNITDSTAVPTISSGWGTGATIGGRDYGFFVSCGTACGFIGVVNFNATYPNAPICVGSELNGPSDGNRYTYVSTTTQLTITSIPNVMPNSKTFNVQCRGY